MGISSELFEGLEGNKCTYRTYLNEISSLLEDREIWLEAVTDSIRTQKDIVRTRITNQMDSLREAHKSFLEIKITNIEQKPHSTTIHFLFDNKSGKSIRNLNYDLTIIGLDGGDLYNFRELKTSKIAIEGNSARYVINEPNEEEDGTMFLANLYLSKNLKEIKMDSIGALKQTINSMIINGDTLGLGTNPYSILDSMNYLKVKYMDLPYAFDNYPNYHLYYKSAKGINNLFESSN